MEMTPEEIFQPYAKLALEIINELKIIEQKIIIETDPSSKAILKRQKDNLSYLVNVCFRVTGDFIPVGVSEKAKKYIDDNELGDIFKIGWGEQIKFEKKKNRSECSLKHEHKTPVSSLIAELHQANSLDDVVKIFLKQKIVWILKDEDKRLPKTNRPDPDETYSNAGITVLKNPNPVGHLFNSNEHSYIINPSDSITNI